ncbi:MAG: putative endopeptidase [Myxococcota bacterium]|jgi:putative endopeptidase
MRTPFPAAGSTDTTIPNAANPRRLSRTLTAPRRAAWAPVIALTLLAGCGKRPAPSADVPSDASESPLDALTRDVQTSMDTAADPCTDFYRYACGGWLDSTTIPDDKSSVTRSFTAIADSNLETLRTILERAAEAPGDDPDVQRIGSYYGACMDQPTVDARGADPIAEDLAAVAQIDSRDALVRTLAELHYAGLGGLWGSWVDADAKSPDTYVLNRAQGGLGLPDRDYYLSDDPNMVEIRASYLAHVEKMLPHAGTGADQAKATAERILAFETRLAEASWPRVDLRDAEKVYNKLDKSEVAASMPSWDWEAYFAAVKVEQPADVVVMTPSYFEKLDGILAETELSTIRDYLSWNIVNRAAPHLSSEIESADFAFYGTVLRGQQEEEPRWKRCVRRTDGALGELLAQRYIEAAFPGDSKAIALDMIQRIEGAFEQGLPDLEWMDDATRAQAVQKARAITNKIGYPDKWRTYPGLTVSGDDYWGNLKAHWRHESARELGRIGKPVDKSEWYMTPPTVNAYYNPTGNEIVFPAGILQPPFFDASYPKAFNFGAIGMVMGHEISHGFDDEGRKFAPTGELKEWWAAEVSERFEERAACVVEQFDGFEVEPGLSVNGKLTLGENIADLGGIKLAYEAYQSHVAEHGAEPEMGGLTPEQQFYVAYAQGWCTLRRPEIARQYAQTDPHSPPDFRVNGPLMNTPAFAEAFACEPGDPMVRADLCQIW